MHLLLYNCGLAAAFLVALPYFLYKGSVTGKYFASFRERLGRLPANLNPDRRETIWVHAVSVGEVLAARPLLARLKARFPERRLVLSTTTTTGQALARRHLTGIVDALFYAPFDWPPVVRRVLEVVRPTLLVLVETELWPNLIHQAHRRGTRIAVVNGRISPRSFPRYRLVRRLLRPVLAEIDLLLMQAEPHAERAVAIGAPAERVRVPGNLKYDGLGDGQVTPESERLLAERPGPLWVAGSTVEGEETLVLTAFREMRAVFPAARLLLAPRHPERFEAVPALIAAAGFSGTRRTSLGAEGWREGDVLLLDTLGELASLYPAADVVFVGGSLVPKGGHNVLEAAVSGKAVVVGPHMENFQEIAREFLGEGALVQIAGAESLGAETVALLRDDERRQRIGKQAQALVERNRGAVERTLEALAGLVS